MDQFHNKVVRKKFTILSDFESSLKIVSYLNTNDLKNLILSNLWVYFLHFFSIRKYLKFKT